MFLMSQGLGWSLPITLFSLDDFLDLNKIPLSWCFEKRPENPKNILSTHSFY